MPLTSINPFTSNPPRLPSPTKARFHSHSRSLSRSPVRQHPRDLDPLLRDLSPTATLRAFVTPPTDTRNSDALAASTHASSASERALGAKAARACLDLRTWTLEMEDWQWPGTFDFPEHARDKLRMLASSSDRQAANDGDEDYWGCLPARTVQAYERRADEIGQCLDEMDVEELKDFVLNSHYRVDSRPSSRDERMSMSSTSSTSMKPLDDYTALVTATILQALPFLTRLGRLLDIWTIRLIVLRNAPRYIQDLQRAQFSVDNGWTAIAESSNIAGVPRFDRKTMIEMKSSIEQEVGSLGRRLDRFLDDLEGREDTVPDSWIVEFELLESGYGSWVVQADRRVLENEWWLHKQSNAEPDLKSVVGKVSPSVLHDHVEISEIEDPESDDDAVVRISMDRDEDKVVQQPAPTNNIPHLAKTIPSAMEAMNAERSADAVPQNSIDRDEDKVARQPDLTKSIPHQAVSIPSAVDMNAQRSADAVVRTSMNRDEAQVAQQSTPTNDVSHHAVETNAERSDDAVVRTRMDRNEDQVAQQSISTNDLVVSIPSAVETNTERSASESATTSSRTETPISAQEDGPGQLAKRRAAFLHDIEINNSLKQSKSPVRPFEHASSAFTKLFKKNQSPEQAKPKLKRSTSNNVFSPVNELSTSTKWTGANRQVSGSSKSLNAMRPDLDAINNKSAIAQADAQRVVSKPAETYTSTVDAIPVSVSEKPPLETYKPTGLDSPFSSPDKEDFSETVKEDFPNNWPLNQVQASQVKEDHSVDERQYHQQPEDTLDESDSGPEIYKPKRPIQTDAFDELFVQTMPTISMEEQRDAAIDSALERDGPNQVLSGSPAQVSIRPSFPRATSSPPASPQSSHESNAEDVPIIADAILVARPYPIKRASTTSIDVYSRSEVKSVDVQRPSRQNSSSSKATPPHTPRLIMEPESSSKTRSMNYKTVSALPTPPPMRRTSLPSQTTSPLGRATPIVVRAVKESSPLAEERFASPSSALAAAPLNVAMTKRRAKNFHQKENERPASPIGTPNVSYPDVRDTFDRHVSEVLETLPAPIRFKSRAGAETPISRERGYIAPRTKTPNMRVPSKPTSMTIAPAESSPKKTDPEVKLYHLTQAGRDEPIKLFVRLVGEGERVMVRVGGGWVDLHEYLRGFVTHHGSRTVSDGGLEVQSITAPLTRKVSGPAEMRAKTPGPGTSKPATPQRPGSNDSDKDWFGRAKTPNGDVPNTSNGRQTPTSLHEGSSTPKSTSTGSSRPSTANASRPPSRQGGTGDIGLAGSSGKKALAEHKAKWVEGMLERAKQASAEKSKDDNQKYFSELGKAGGTRRVIFRSSPGFSTGEKGKQ